MDWVSIRHVNQAPSFLSRLNVQAPRRRNDVHLGPLHGKKIQITVKVKKVTLEVMFGTVNFKFNVFVVF